MESNNHDNISTHRDVVAVEQPNLKEDVVEVKSDFSHFSLTIPDDKWRFPKESDCLEGDWDFYRKKGMNPAHAKADFNGDGLEDHSWIMIKKDGKAWGLFVFFIKEKHQPKMVTLVEYNEKDEHWSSDDYCRMGVGIYPPGKYRTACAKGYGDPCEPDEPEEIYIKTPAVDFYMFESANSIFYWDNKIQGFKREWISD